MIVGGYTLDLYCRYGRTSAGSGASDIHHLKTPESAQFTGESFADCKKQAKRKGWRFVTRDGHKDTICPSCAKP